MTKILLHPSNKSVECAPGHTVLMALENAGFALPNNCRAGACGECKVRVVSGEFDQGVVLDMALSQKEREQGFGLMCMAKPISESLTIEWGTKDAKPKLFPPRENALFVLTDKRMVAAKVAELRLRPVGQPIRYWPGQYVMVVPPNRDVSPRAYSIANAPRPDGEIVLQVAKMDDGTTSHWIHDTLIIGESVKLSGAYGTFIGDPSMDTPVLCIAAGTGLAPILSLAEAALRRGFKRPVNLVYSVRSEQDVYGLGLMSWWHTKHRNFDYKITLTREKVEGRMHGRIDTVLPSLFKDLSKHTIFSAGSPEFSDACSSVVQSLGALSENIYTEGFFPKQQPEVADADHLLLGNP